VAHHRRHSTSGGGIAFRQPRQRRACSRLRPVAGVLALSPEPRSSC
jgi:hypothetical protein